MFFLNWHTGELHNEDFPQPPGGFPTFEDLDSPALVQPICAPVTRWSATGIHRWGPLPFAYAAPFAAEIGEAGEPSLRRCASPLAHRLPGEGARTLQIGAGVLS